MASTPKIAEDLFYELRRQILSGNLAPGTRLPPERKLAGAYGTNRNTLREAIGKLEQAGLVSVRHGQGVTVLDFREMGTIDLLEPYLVHGTDPQEKVRAVTDILSARTRVLEYAMELVVQRATEEDLVALNEVTDALLEAWDAQDRAAIAAWYSRWLETLIDAADSLAARWIANPLIDLNERLIERFPGMWIMDDGFPSYIRESTGALRRRDLSAAVSANRDYYAKIDQQILSILGWVIQSGMAALEPGPGEDDAEARRRRRDVRKAASRRRRLTAELAAAAQRNDEPT